MYLNHVTMMGRMTANPEIRQTQNDSVVCKFDIAVDRSKKKNESLCKTDFFRCIAWNGTAKLLEKYFQKGDRVIVEGSLRNRQYLDKREDKRTIAEIHVERIFFVEKRSDVEQEAELEELF